MKSGRVLRRTIGIGSPAVQQQAPTRLATLASHLLSYQPLARRISRWQIMGSEVISKLDGAPLAALSAIMGENGNGFVKTLRNAASLARETQARITQLEKEIEKLNHENEQLSARNKELKQKVATDGLTQLYTKESFNARLAQEIARSRRHERDLSLLMLDIDHFKGVNDRYGHPVGDEVLKQLSEILQRFTRKGDYIARWGGEEFAIILPETDDEGAATVAEKIRQAVAENVFKTDKGDLEVTISVGVAGLEKTYEIGKLIELADQALYQAKHGGRNQVVVAEKLAA